MKKQNLVLKVGIGLVLGIGVLMVAPRTAQAAQVCPPDTPPTQTRDDIPCTGNCQWQNTTFHDKGCYDLDGNCSKETHYVEEVILQYCDGVPCFHHNLVTTPAPC